MEIRVLRYFVTVAREENITKAAEKLNITQPTLSRQIHQLEEEFGKRLFKRGNHDIKLTEDGYLLRNHTTLNIFCVTSSFGGVSSLISSAF